MRVVPDLTGILGVLTPREEQIVRMHLGIGQRRRTFENIGRQFAVNRSRVHFIYQRALNKLADPEELRR